MVTFTLFGGSEVEMQPDSQLVVTLFGGTEIYCPTVTQELIRRTEETSPSSPWSKRDAMRRSNLYVTFFGGISINRPPLGREYMDLKNLIASGAIDLRDFQVLWMQHTSQPLRRHYRTITVFGSCEQAAPSKRAEVKEIDNLRQTNAITAEEHKSLQALIGEDRNVALNGLPQIVARFLPSASGSRA
jgi:hypothetical protein